MNELDRWGNFYLLTSAAAATLIGLLFVIMTLAGARNLTDTSKIRIYLTPTIIYFASVLLLAAVLTFPNHTRLSSTICICFLGMAGIVYTGFLFVKKGVRMNYHNFLNRIPYAGFPFVAYGLLIFGGILLLHQPQLGLTLAAAGMLSLLAVAIRYSWSIAVDLVSSPSA